jgi:hypothetical protein
MVRSPMSLDRIGHALEDLGHHVAAQSLASLGDPAVRDGQPVMNVASF